MTHKNNSSWLTCNERGSAGSLKSNSLRADRTGWPSACGSTEDIATGEDATSTFILCFLDGCFGVLLALASGVVEF